MARCHRRSRYVVAKRAIATSVLETAGVALRVSAATYLPCVWRRLAIAAGLLMASPVALAALIAGPIEQAPVMSDAALAEVPVDLLPVYIGAAATCPGLPWQVLAGIGLVESNHARGLADPQTGDVAPPIIGPALDGRPGFAAIADPTQPDGWAHALGPMQFLSTTWRSWGRLAPDRPTSTIPDPHNAWDAIYSAAAYLCGEAGRIDDLEAALRRYNNSGEYAARVIAAAARYGTAEPAAASGELRTVGGITVAAELAPSLEALLAAAEADDISLGGGGYRSGDQQIALRRTHCGTSNYAIYEMSPSLCSPPTARPGSSMHEQGLAIDFTCDGLLITSRTDECYRWLAAHAVRFGLYELRTGTEPWHWSTTAS
jgi:hypothetical protein